MNIFAFEPLIPNQKWIASPQLFSKKARAHFTHYLANGYYKKIDEGLIVMDISQSNCHYIGLIGLLDLKDYKQGKLIQHESVLASQQQISTELLIERKAMIKPAVVTYAPNQKIDNLLYKYAHTEDPFLEFDFEDCNEKRKFWLINKHDISFKIIQQTFKEEVRRAYIADGHHRFAAARWLNEEKKYPPTILCSLFSFDQMDIFDFNRVVKKPTDLSSGTLINALSKYVHIQAIDKARKPRRKFEMIMNLNSKWYQLKWRTNLLELLKPKHQILFDAELLNEYILQPFFGIEDIKNNSRVSYVSGVSGLSTLKKKLNNQQVAFLLYPIQFSELTQIVDRGGLLPPKSTWFEPRMYNGIIATQWP